jgi:RNA polymerase sigma-70 factor (ECF subfamily)
MYRVAINTALTIKRKDRCQLVNTEISEPMLLNNQEEYDYETEERLKILYQAIEKLGKVERAIILLWLEERRYEEISEIIGISKKNVSVKLVRIRKKLDELIKQHSNYESHENK